MTTGSNLRIAESLTTYDKGLTELLMNIASDERVAVRNFLDTFKVNQLSSLTIFDFFEAGFTKEAAEKVNTAIQFAIKINQLELPPSEVVRTPQDAYSIVSYLKYSIQEKFLVVALDTKHKVIAKKELFVGTINSCTVHPREVFQFAIRHFATEILVAHQHPAGSVQPSPEDIQVTHRLVEAGNIIGIPLMDHIIVGEGNNFTSLKEKGLLS